MWSRESFRRAIHYGEFLLQDGQCQASRRCRELTRWISGAQDMVEVDSGSLHSPPPGHTQPAIYAYAEKWVEEYDYE